MRETIREICEELNITRTEAELILSTILKRPRFELYLNKELDENHKKILKWKLTLLKNGVPIEYITKQVQFHSYRLTVYPGVFIPRLETEYFVELIFQLINCQPERILEIGTGCGAIAIALAFYFPRSRIYATDISYICLKNADENITRYDLKDRIYLIGADLFSSIKSNFGLIVSNPPYIPIERFGLLPKSVREFEPRRAIDGGKGGVQIIRKIIDQGIEFIGKQGLIALEIDEEEVPCLTNYIKGKGLPFIFKKDLFGRYRYLFVGINMSF